MNWTKFPVYLMTALLVLVTGLLGFLWMLQENFPLSVEVISDGGSETVGLWYRDNCYHVFLPGYADPDQVILHTNRLTSVSIDGRQITDGETCGGFPLSEPLRLTYQRRGQSHERTILFVRSSDTPALFIDTVSGSMDSIHEEKGNSEAGYLRLYDTAGELNCDAQIQAIAGRGNSTWEADKKPYNLELASPRGLLGMGAAKKWILLANAYDVTHINNKMCFDFARSVGCAYTPECQWVDLYLNGEYAGLYLLSERNELDPERIAVDAERSFLLSLSSDWQLDKSLPHIQSDRRLFLRIHQQGLSDSRIRQIWQSTENAVYADDGIDPVTGKHWTELIDMDSWARQFLLDEVFVDYDAFALSQFFYYEPDSGKLFGGPIWDADNILDRSAEHPANILAAQRPYVWNEVETPLCWMLWQKEEFRQQVKALYREEFRAGLLALAESGIDDYVNQCRGAAAMDAVRWTKSGADAESARMAQYLRERVAFLDDYWTNEEEFVHLDIGSDAQWRRFAVRKGDTALFLREHSSLLAQAQWERFDTRAPFDLSEPVRENTVLWMVLP